MGRMFHHEVDCRARHHHSRQGHRRLRFIVAGLCAACMLQFASEARAQCSARDVLQSQLKLRKAPPTDVPQVLIRSAADVPVWKTITLGTFANTLTLVNALHAMGCHVGGLAAEILARPAFIVGATKTDVELVAVSAAELGFMTDSVTLTEIYARARQLGFAIAAPEVGPQLRLQYPDQPIGEFLTVAMEPIKTWSGEPVILSVANGGAGLILIGQDGGHDAEVSVISRFVFVRSNKAVSAHEIEKAAALLPL
jgi:hypothetical protein